MVKGMNDSDISRYKSKLLIVTTKFMKLKKMPKKEKSRMSNLKINYKLGAQYLTLRIFHIELV